MKRLVICGLLIAAMITGGILVSAYTESVTARTSEKLVRLNGMTGTADKAELVAEAEAVSAEWETFCANNIFLTNNECAFEISESLVHIIAELRTGDGDITEECEETLMLLDIYEKSRELSLANIF